MVPESPAATLHSWHSGTWRMTRQTAHLHLITTVAGWPHASQSGFTLWDLPGKQSVNGSGGSLSNGCGDLKHLFPL